MPPLNFMNMGKPPPVEPPRPVVVRFGTDVEREAYKRLLFAKYLYVTGRLGRDDLEADR